MGTRYAQLQRSEMASRARATISNFSKLDQDTYNTILPDHGRRNRTVDWRIYSELSRNEQGATHNIWGSKVDFVVIENTASPARQYGKRIELICERGAEAQKIGESTFLHLALQL